MSKHPKFRAGDEIEIANPDTCMQGILYPGKVIGPALNEAKIVVQYKTLMSKNCTGMPLIETVERAHVRPKQPVEHGRKFKLDDVVDAFYDGGWREGVITEVLEGVGRFVVQFRFCQDVHEIAGTDVRVHREWCNGSWNPPEDDNEDLSSSMISKFRSRKRKFTSGELVEIRIDDDGFNDAWFAATIVNAVEKDEFLVEYKDLRNDNDTESLKEVIDAMHIRPYPPELVVVDGYNLNEKVDALYNDGWWEGKICRKLCRARYKVYFKGTNDEMVFHYSELRPHQDWINDTWVTASRD